MKPQILHCLSCEKSFLTKTLPLETAPLFCPHCESDWEEKHKQSDNIALAGAFSMIIAMAALFFYLAGKN